MSKSAWLEANQRYLMAAVDSVQAALEIHAAHDEIDRRTAAQQALTDPAAQRPAGAHR